MGIEVAIGLAIGASVLGAAGSIQEGNAAASASRWNAHMARLEAEENERRSRRESDMLVGRQRAATASQGTTLEGSPMMIVKDTVAEAEIEALHIRSGGSARVAAYQKQGDAAQFAGMLGAGSSLLQGAGKAMGYTI